MADRGITTFRLSVICVIETSILRKPSFFSSRQEEEAKLAREWVAPESAPDSRRVLTRMFPLTAKYQEIY